MTAFVKGFMAFFAAFGFILKHRLVVWYLIPVVLWLILATGTALWLGNLVRPIVIDWVSQWLPDAEIASDLSFWQTIKKWLTGGIQILTGFLLQLMLFYLLARVMKYVILIITSPLLAWLSEKTEEILTGREYPFQLHQFLKDIVRGIFITLRNLMLELLLITLGFILSLFFPPLSPLITVALFFVSSWFMGFSMYDYWTERQKMGVRQSVAYLRHKRMLVLGLGTAYTLVSLIPFADWVIAPVNGSVGAVMSLNDESEPTSLSGENLPSAG